MIYFFRNNNKINFCYEKIFSEIFNFHEEFVFKCLNLYENLEIFMYFICIYLGDYLMNVF